MADEQKLASKLVIEYNKQKVSNAVLKAAEDSDDDDLAGWHLDWVEWSDLFRIYWILLMFYEENMYILFDFVKWFAK